MVTSIINQKGGTGKTTTAVNLGSALSIKKKKVLIIDLDPQGNLSYSMGINEMEYTMEDVLSGNKKIKEIIFDREGMMIAPADQRLSRLEFNSQDVPEYLLRNALAQDKEYDHILIDCPPSLSYLTVNALSASDNVVIPVQLDVFSIQGLAQVMDTIDEMISSFNSELKILGVLPVLVDGRKKLTCEIKEYVKENFDICIFENQIRTNVKAAEAPSFGKSVINYCPASNSAEDYLKFSDEYLKKIEQ